MTKMMHLFVLAVALTSACGALSASAGAVTWQNTGSTTYTATSGTVTLSSTSAALSCTGSTATGTAPANLLGAVYASGGTATFNGCSLSGITTGVDCAFTQTAASQDGTGMGSVITGAIDVTCGIYMFNTKICHIEGTATGGGGYHNTTPGRLTGPTSFLRLTNVPTGGTCPLGSNDLADITPQIYTVTSANSPTVTRTA